jgi:prolyl oligopeptidase
MKIYTVIISFLILCIILPCSIMSREKEDNYLWLEEIEGEKALKWVRAKNKNTIEVLQNHPEFNEINEKILAILNSKERIAHPSIRGEYIYNFWQDDKNRRGLLRRASVTEYLKDLPEWETVLDLDLLCEEEREKWAFKGAAFLYPEFNICILALSRGGSDAVVMREFDLEKKTFIKDGFYVPQAKGDVSWIDKNTLLISTDFGEGTLTTSGYPRIAKIWKRGTPLKEAKTVFEGKEKDVGVWGSVQNTPERQYVIIYRTITF